MIEINTISADENNGVSRVEVCGRLDGTNAQQLEQALLAAIGDGGQIVVLDFSRLHYISSAGLRVILIAAKKTKQGGGRFAICGLGEVIRKVFEMSGFLAMLQVYESFDDARTALTG